MHHARKDRFKKVIQTMYLAKIFFLQISGVLLILASIATIKSYSLLFQTPGGTWSRKEDKFFDMNKDFEKVKIKLASGMHIPVFCISGNVFSLMIKVQNRSHKPISSGLGPARAFAQPVNISYKMFGHSSFSEGRRYFLDYPLRLDGPGHFHDTKLSISCPSSPGIYRMSVQLVQEGVAWQDQMPNPSGYVSQMRLLSIKYPDRFSRKKFALP